METKWITYSRFGRGLVKTVVAVRLEDEPAPYGKCSEVRASLPDEIARELAERNRRKQELEAITEFQSREDYQDARQIASALEFLTPDSHSSLDALTPEEWRSLRERIYGNHHL